LKYRGTKERQITWKGVVRGEVQEEEKTPISLIAIARS
jgi:hypothetical protein